MKRLLGIVLITACFTSCNEDAVNIKVDTDSLNTKLENVGETIENKAEQVWDTTKAKASDLKDRAEKEWDSLKNNRDKDTIDQK